MIFRGAKIDDLPEIKRVYTEITAYLDDKNISIWDEIYPNEFFIKDIEEGGLYILENDQEIVAAFALCKDDAGAKAVKWTYDTDKVLYLNRLGVNIRYLRRGIGEYMLKKSLELAAASGAESVRLFVVDYNKPAIDLYVKNGFIRAEGIYVKHQDVLTLREYGYEIFLLDNGKKK